MTGPRVAAPIFPLYGAIITEPRVDLLSHHPVTLASAIFITKNAYVISSAQRPSTTLTWHLVTHILFLPPRRSPAQRPPARVR